MSFFVDIITEDSFYENLTLGVLKILDNTTCVTNTRVDQRNGCDKNSITTWEQRHCCTLPEDIKNFYASIDGFLLQWNLEIYGEEFPVGCMEINSLSQLKRYQVLNKENNASRSDTSETEESCRHEATESEEADVPSTSGTQNSINPRNCKMFELARCSPESVNDRVYLVYRANNDRDEPSIWLRYDKTDSWCHLSDNFTKYFRMMLVHLGLPLWQLCAARLPLPTWVEQIYYLVGPHLLPSNGKPKSSVSTTLWNEGPINTLDPSIFKSRETRQSRSLKKK